MNVLQFIIENWDFILLIVAAVASIVFFAFKGNKSVVMKMLDALVTEAERAYGGGTGTLKLAAVVEAVYPNLPTIIKMFISDKVLTKWIEDALKAAKKKWKKNAALAEYVGQSANTEADTAEEPGADAILSTFERDSYE